MGAHFVATEHGRPASAALAQAIVDAKSGTSLAPVTVVVPSNFAGLAARRLLGSGDLGVGGVANVNFFTPFRLAELLAVGQLDGRTPLTNPVLGAAVRRALADDPRHFRTVREHRSTESALAAMVGELSNVSSAGREAIREEGGHAGATIELFDAIRSHLRSFHDEADVARAAAHRSDLAEAVRPFGHIIWYLPGALSAPLASFLRSVLGVAPATVIAAVTPAEGVDAEVARSLRIAGFELAETDPTATLPVADHVISVTDADEEVRAVIREIVQLVDRGVPLDRIGIFHPVPDPYVRILEQQFDAADIPANGPSRRRVAESIAGRVLMSALALPSARWRRDRVIALANSGPIRNGSETARPAAWDELSRRAGVVGGLGDWRAKLAAHHHRLGVAADEAHSQGQDRRARRLRGGQAEVDELAGFVEQLAESIDAVQNATGWRARSEAAAQLLHSLLGPSQVRGWWGETELDAFERVEAALDRLATLDTIDPEPTFAVFLRALDAELSVARGRSGRFGHGVVYGPLSGAVGHDLEAVFVLGCAEGVCPAPRREDTMLPDRVRKLANGDLPLRAGRLEEQHRMFLAAVSSAPQGRRWLFFPRGDLRSSRRNRPSRWLLPTASRLAGRRLYTTDFEHESPPGVHEIPSHAQALSDASYYTSVAERDCARLFDYVRHGGQPEGHPVAELVARGMRAHTSRRGTRFTEFDGHVGAGRAALGLGAGESSEPLSASRLETWAECGFRYFLRYVLGLSERDDPEHTVELSALDRGSALHLVLELFLREQVELGPPAPDEAWTTAQRERAREIAVQVFADYERRGRTGRPIEWDTQKRDLLALIDDFLDADDRFRAEHRATPAAFELQFGMAGEPDLELDLDDGRSLRFRGSIDRVDTAPRARHIVSDYKTGKGAGYRGLAGEDDPVRAGTLLQLGLYAEAVAARLGDGTVTSDYWMVNTEADFARHGYAWTDDHRARLLQVLATIADGIERGVFPAVPGDWHSFRSAYENCTYCEFDSVCPQDRAEHADQKALDPALEVRVELLARPERVEDEVSDALAPAETS